MTQGNKPQEQNQSQGPIFSLDKIYIKDLSLELPNAPKIFLRNSQPNIELNLSYNSEKIDDGVYQTTLHAVISAKIENEQMFLIEIDQAGIFQIRNITNEQIDLLQSIECPTILFPYLREAVSDLTTRAGFMPVLLAPVNFAYLYQQKKQAEANTVSQAIN